MYLPLFFKIFVLYLPLFLKLKQLFPSTNKHNVNKILNVNKRKKMI